MRAEEKTHWLANECCKLMICIHMVPSSNRPFWLADTGHSISLGLRLKYVYEGPMDNSVGIDCGSGGGMCKGGQREKIGTTVIE